MNYIRTFFNIIKDTFIEWNEDRAPRLAAALSYYTAFSLAPLLIVIIALVGAVIGQSTVRAEVMEQIKASIGPGAAEVINDLISNTNQPGQGIISSVLGIAALILGAVGVFNNLQTSLDIIWDVDDIEREGGLKHSILFFLKDKLLSFSMILVVGFLLLVSLVISTTLSFLGTYVVDLLPAAEFLLNAINFVISFGVITLLFMLVYKYLPHAEIRWRDVAVGAAFTALLFTIGKTVLGWYLARSTTASTYGAAGTFVVILLWVYYSAQILLFGAEFTQVYARRYGSQIVSIYAAPEPIEEDEPDMSRQDSPDVHRDKQTVGGT